MEKITSEKDLIYINIYGIIITEQKRRMQNEKSHLCGSLH